MSLLENPVWQTCTPEAILVITTSKGTYLYKMQAISILLLSLRNFNLFPANFFSLDCFWFSSFEFNYVSESFFSLFLNIFIHHLKPFPMCYNYIVLSHTINSYIYLHFFLFSYPFPFLTSIPYSTYFPILLHFNKH
jgi:hypothetical protein